MERSEPPLVPEWLLHQSDRQPRAQQCDSNERTAARRTSGFAGERSAFDKNGFASGRVYPNFNSSVRRSSSSNSSSYEKDAAAAHRTDWDVEKERTGRYLIEGNNNREQERSSWSLGTAVEQEFPSSGRLHRLVASSSRPFDYSEKRIESGLVSGLSSGVQKAVFERNFPSLGAQEKPYSSLGNVTVLNRTRASDGVVSSSSSSASSSESWASPSSNLPEPSSNGVISSSYAGTGLNGPKMAEALVQSIPRVKTPPHLSETQRLEELVLKQSRQLVPMIPKSPVPTSKPKPKTSSAIASSASSKPVTQASNSQLMSPGYRSQPSLRPDSGKLLLLRTNPAAPLKPDSASAAARTSAPAAPPSLSNLQPRKQKQLLDRRAVPIPPLLSPAAGGPQDAPSGAARPKENGAAAATEDKRLSKNRSDFFNSLRKKATASPGGGEKQPELKNEAVPQAEQQVLEQQQQQQQNENGTRDEALASGSSSSRENGNKALVEEAIVGNGVAPGHEDEEDVKPRRNLVGGSEEEEAAFLRSLGWKEDAEGGEDALTEEEINAFYQAHMRSMTSNRHSRLQNAVLGMRAGCGPAVNPSDSEADAEALKAAAARLQA